MERGIDVALVLSPRTDKYHRVGRLVAMTCGDDATKRWSGEAMLHRESRTGNIVLGAVVLASGMPPEICSALRGALQRTWHHGGEVRIVGPDCRPLTGPKALAALRAICRPGERKASTKAIEH